MQFLHISCVTHYFNIKFLSMEDVNLIWNNVLAILREEVQETTFYTWIVPLVCHGFNEDETEVTLLSGHSFAVTFLMSKHAEQIKKAFKAVTDKDIEIKIIYNEELAKQLQKASSKAKLQEPAKNQPEEKKSKYENLMQMQSGAKLNLKYKFENFVVGKNNEFAHAAAIAVAQNPGKKFNPLFIYGGSGLGKTHLMQAIGHYVLYHYPHLKIRFVKSEDFVNDLISSINAGFDTNNKMSKFRQKYREVDLLLLDDIQFIIGKDRTEIEIFNLFEALYNNGKQIVITSDRPPSEFSISDRLKTRFTGGILADIKQPELEVRIAILQNLAKQEKIELSIDVAEFVANLFSDNVRELEGAFNKISIYSKLYNSPMNIDRVKEIFDYSHMHKKIELNTVVEEVAQFFDINYKDILGACRAQKISLPRQIAIYLLKELTDANISRIAEFLDKKHTTIMYAYEKIKTDMQTDRKLSSYIDQLTEKIKNNTK